MPTVALGSNTWVGPVGLATEGETMAGYLSQEHWGRVCLHCAAALRAGHWGWHLAGIKREMEWVRLKARWASALANGWPELGNNPKANPA
jgi:hypothetical protein